MRIGAEHDSYAAGLCFAEKASVSAEIGTSRSLRGLAIEQACVELDGGIASPAYVEEAVFVVVKYYRCGPVTNFAGT